MSARHRFALPVLSGVLLGAGYFNLPFPFFNFVAFLPLLHWLEREPRSHRDILRAGVVFGLSAHLLALHWVWAMLSISWLASLMYLGLVLFFITFVVLALSKLLLSQLKKGEGKVA